MLDMSQITHSIIQEKLDIFYSDGDSYWSGTLIRIGRKEDDNRTHQLKTYNK